MLPQIMINLKIGDGLRQVLSQRSCCGSLKDPVPGILWGKDSGESEERFMIGFYERDLIPTDDPIRLIEADGIEFLVIQDWICWDLDGKQLDVVNGELLIIDPVYGKRG